MYNFTDGSICGTNLERPVAGLAHVVAWDEGVLDAEVGGAVARRHARLHLLLGEVGPRPPHPDRRAKVVEVAPVQLEKFCKEKRVYLKPCLLSTGN